MTTLFDMGGHIQADMRRSSSAFQTASGRYIQEAIRHYAGMRWWFNEMTATSATAAGTEFYDLPTDMRVVDYLSLTISQDPYTLTPRTNGYFEEAFTPAAVFTGKPTDYTIFKNQARLYPIPDAVYTLTWSGHGNASTTEDDDASPWANEAYDLIKARSCALICQYYLRDLDGYKLHKVAETDELDRLTAENARRVTRGRVRAWEVC